jgi:hypothetical protein
MPAIDTLNQFASCPSPSFESWTQLTDAYAKQFFLMHRGDKTARLEALRLAQELQRLNRSMSAEV